MVFKSSLYVRSGLPDCIGSDWLAKTRDSGLRAHQIKQWSFHHSVVRDHTIHLTDELLLVVPVDGLSSQSVGFLSAPDFLDPCSTSPHRGGHVSVVGYVVWKFTR